MGYDFPWYFGVGGQCLVMYPLLFTAFRSNWNATFCDLSTFSWWLSYAFHWVSLIEVRGITFVMVSFQRSWAGIEAISSYTE